MLVVQRICGPQILMAGLISNMERESEISFLPALHLPILETGLILPLPCITPPGLVLLILVP